ncbi:ABC transporter ATP-binding protein [Streptomyces sp. NBC_01508]|uniref:ABC transporter ATP-binding protein n=1 Tax=Streptomyces sp. NBC_01508 TaxID=2903888 RepID=UPI0038693E9E
MLTGRGEPEEASAAPPLTTWRVARRMAGRFTPYRWQVAASLLLVVLVGVLGIVTHLLIGKVIDDALPDRDPGTLALLCSTMLVLGVLTSVFGVAETAFTQWVGQRVTAGLRIDVFDRARAQSLDFYSEHGESRIQARLVSDIEGVSRFLTGTAQSLLASFTTLASALVVMVILSWPIAVVSVALAAALSSLNNRYAQKRRSLFSRRQRHLTSVLRYVSEDLSLGGIVLGRTLGRTHRQRARFVEKAEQIRDVTYEQRMAGATALTFIAASFACVPPAVYWLAGTWFSHLSIGTIVVLVILQTRLAGPIQSLLSLSGSLQASVAMFERIIEFLDLPLQERDGTAGTAPAHRVSRPPLAVGLREVSWRYAGADRAALDGVTLDLAPGSVNVVVGRTGSGKSTLAMLLAGLLPPHSGTVDLTTGAGTDTGTGTGTAGLRESVVLVPQHTTLFDGTLRENLSFARDDVTTADMDAALGAVCLDELVASLPDTYDTRVGGGGHRLSGGERQRLGIARALLAPCRMLVVDEATSALDPDTARAVDDALRAHCHDKTLVMIAHRIPQLEPTDRVIVMERGRITESGKSTESQESHAYAEAHADDLAHARSGTGPPR